MSGRLNPREYDLGELRDAARKPPDRRTAGRERPNASADDRTVTVEPAADIGEEDASERGADPTVESRPGSAGRRADVGAEAAGSRQAGAPADGDVEEYLRARQRRNRDVADRPAERDRDRPSRDRQRSDPETAARLAELSGPEVSKPYLERLPDGYGAQLEVFEWLDAMLSAAGEESTLAALEYYESIGWLSERSRSQLEDVAAGLPAPEGAGRPFDVADHRESLVYVARLAQRLR